MSINNPGQSSACNQASSSTFPPSTFPSSTFPPSTSGHHQRLSSVMADQFLPFEASVAGSGSNRVSSVWNDATQRSSNGETQRSSNDATQRSSNGETQRSSNGATQRSSNDATQRSLDGDWLNEALGSRGNFSSSLPSFSRNIYDQGVKESDTESISDEEESFFSDYTDSEDEEGEDEFKVRLRRLNRWMDSDLSPVQQVVTILSLVNRSKKLSPVSKSFIKSHINIFNRQNDENVSSDEDRDDDPKIGTNSDRIERRRKRRLKREEEEERDFDRKVQDANSLNFWQLYFNSRGNVPRNDELLDLLLQYLPLVHVDVHGNGNRISWTDSPDVTPLNILYLHLISGVLSKVVSLKLQPASSELLSKSRSLMSIALISRCFTREQKASLNSQFMTKLLLQSHASIQLQSQSSNQLQSGFDPRSFILFSHANQAPSSDDTSTSSRQQFNSFLPSLPSSFNSSQSSQELLNRNRNFPPTDLSLVQSGQKIDNSGQLNRSELSAARPPLPPVPTGSKSEEQKKEEQKKREPFSGEGMSGVPSFLKTLRLHKYTDCFASLPSLSAFMNLSESDLESLGVAAKGARKKFCQHLEKLRSRPQTLSHLLLSPDGSVDGDILPGIQSALSAGPLSKESKTEINLIVHLLLKVKSVELTTEQNLQLIQTIDKCLQFPIWSREDTRMLIQLKEPVKIPPSCLPSKPREASSRFGSIFSPSPPFLTPPSSSEEFQTSEIDSNRGKKDFKSSGNFF